MSTTVTITRRTRSLGFGWSTIPTGVGTEIREPSGPQYEGTVRQVLETRRVDRLLRSLGDVFKRTGWFYKRQQIVAIDGRPDELGWFNMMFGSLVDGEVDSLVVTIKA